MAFFGRFTESTKALLYAQEEARNIGHNYVGTEHSPGTAPGRRRSSR